MTDSMIATAMNGYLVNETQQVKLGPVIRTLKEGTLLYPSEIMSLSVVQHNVGRRPIVWSVTAGSGVAGLREYLVQRGLGRQLQTALPDTTDPDLDLHRLAGAPLHIPATEELVYRTYRYAGLLEHGAADLEPTPSSAAASLALPLVQLVYAQQARGDREGMERALRQAVKLSPNPELREALLELLVAPADSSLLPAPGAPPD
jgi:hypothetical protein